jgi:hypothetical protein
MYIVALSATMMTLRFLKLFSLLSWLIDVAFPRFQRYTDCAAGNVTSISSINRLEENEITELYRRYRDEQYNRERLRYEPGYLHMLKLFEDRRNEYHNNRIAVARSLFSSVSRPVETVLDYGGGPAFELSP